MSVFGWVEVGCSGGYGYIYEGMGGGRREGGE